VQSLPGEYKTFDIKTRAIISIRRDVQANEILALAIAAAASIDAHGRERRTFAYSQSEPLCRSVVGMACRLSLECDSRMSASTTT